MHFWEIPMILFCSGNLGEDLRTNTEKKTFLEEKVPFDFFKSTFYYLTSYLF